MLFRVCSLVPCRCFCFACSWVKCFSMCEAKRVERKCWKTVCGSDQRELLDVGWMAKIACRIVNSTDLSAWTEPNSRAQRSPFLCVAVQLENFAKSTTFFSASTLWVFMFTSIHSLTIFIKFTLHSRYVSALENREKFRKCVELELEKVLKTCKICIPDRREWNFLRDQLETTRDS